MLKTGVRFNIFLENAMHLESLNTYLKWIFCNNVKKVFTIPIDQFNASLFNKMS